eukprot:CAMPEP_0174698670 /NCGR_PEP_ID=MMETSP1094-20130205/4197_1 /TAXON_ID=156173 /ORGANISM="Chrysochromulina brevifilum, Strain UTEX LB 985" /LENGTH=60 /DNA_ID=CAMNT_0015895883 /DNA_START=113 /DNA_END=292 /DNA_ORIENTATION=+
MPDIGLAIKTHKLHGCPMRRKSHARCSTLSLLCDVDHLCVVHQQSRQSNTRQLRPKIEED